MKTALALIFVAGVCAFQSGCATIIKGSHQDVPVSSEPSGAAVSVDGVRQGTTPTSLHLSRKESHVVTVEMNGYEAESVILKPSMGGAVAGNILAGGLIGWGVDASTGAQYNLHPDSFSARLRPKAALPTVADLRSRSAVADLLGELEKLDGMKKEGKVTDVEYVQLREATLKKFQTNNP